MKRILILTVNLGNGHNSVANALADLLTKNGFNVTIANPHKENHHLIATTMEKGYKNLMRT